MKEENQYASRKIYEALCSRKENYIGETKRNVITRWNKYEDQNQDSEPAKHLLQHPDHAPTDTCKRKNLESFFITVKLPTLNKQKDSKKLILFRNGVT